MTDLLKKRKEIKSKKPDFIRQDAHKKKRVGTSWRKPRGLQSKMRLHKRGYPKTVSLGYGSPSEVKGLHPSGLKPILVASIRDLEGLSSEKDGVVLSSTLGTKKKLLLISKINELNLKILNIKNVDSYVKDIESKFEKKKQVKKSKFEKRIKKKRELEKQAEEKKKADEKKAKEDKAKSESSQKQNSVEDKLVQDEDKKEKDKLLIKKEM